MQQKLKEAIPGSRVDLSIPIDSLRELPANAVYHSKNGQSSATVSRQGDNILVTATCDSLEREVEYYAELYYQAFKELSELKERRNEEREKETNPISLMLAVVFPVAALIIGFTGGIVTMNNLKNKN